MISDIAERYLNLKMHRNERDSSLDRERYINIFSDEEIAGESYSVNQNLFVGEQPITPTLMQPTIIDYQCNEIRSTESQSTAYRIDPYPIHPVFNNKLLHTVQEPLGSSISHSTTFAAASNNILQETRRGITVYHPASGLSESGTQQSNTSCNAAPFQAILDYGNASVLSRQECAGETRSLSMSSFVPSTHLLSHNQSNYTYKNFQQVPQALLNEKGSCLIQKDSQLGFDQTQTTQLRKENFNKLDKNFQELMQQNSNLEQEIRTMNSQFTKRQNQRIHDQFAVQCRAGPTQVNASQSDSVIGLNKTVLRLDSGGSLVMNNLLSSFDERCAQTKQIVNKLAQRLSEVKLETSIELDRIQSRQSRQGSASNSNSRSPNQGNQQKRVVLVSYQQTEQSRQGSASNSNSRSPNQGIKAMMHCRQNSQNSYQQCNEFQTPFGNSNVSIRRVDARKASRNNLNTTENLVDALGDISAIQTGQTNTNNVSVVSTTGGLGGLNFKLLKPHDSIHASLNELHHHLSKSPRTSSANTRPFGGRESEGESARGTGRQQPSNVRKIRELEQEPLMFDNSPVRKSDASSQFPQKINHESDLRFEQRHGNEQNSNLGANFPKKQFNESLMQIIPQIDSSESVKVNKQRNRVENNQRFSFQMEHPRKEEVFEALKADGTKTLSSSNSQQTLFELKLQTLGPERSPMNVNGAAQLSNILQQINSANNKTRQEAQTTDTQYQISNEKYNQKEKNLNRLNTISPKVSNQAHANFFLSHDNGPAFTQNGGPIMLTQETPTNMPLASKGQMLTDLHLNYIEQEQETKEDLAQVCIRDKESYSNLSKSQIHPDHSFSQFKQNMKANQNNISRQVRNLVQDSLGNQTTYTLDGMTAQTFEKMHNEVMVLQEKIKCLEAKMANSSTRYDVSPTGNVGIGDQKKTLDSGICTVRSERSMLYNHDSKHFQESMDHAILKMTVPKTVVVQKLSDKQVLSPKQGRKTPIPASETSVKKVGHAKNNQNDDKVDKKVSYGTQHRPIMSQPQTYNIMSETLPVQNRNKSRSQVEQSLNLINDQALKHDQSHLIDNVATRKDKNNYGINPLPLHRDMFDLMSQSQPDLVNLRTCRRGSSKASASAKTLSQIGSRKSSKNKSPISGRKGVQGSTRADQKTLQSKKSTRKSSQGNQITPKLKTRSKSKDINTLNAELLAISSSKAVSFKQEQEDEQETRIRLSHHQLTDAYVITNSDQTAPSEITISQRKGSRQQILSPKVIVDCDLQKSRFADTQETNMINEQNLDDYVPSSSSRSNFNKQSLMPRKQSHKQTFPLRIRKNQQFPKGSECPSIPSQSTGAEKNYSNSQVFESAFAEAPMQTEMLHRVSQSTSMIESLQDRIIQQYEVQIENQDRQSSRQSRNTSSQLGGMHHSSELAQVQNPQQMNEYIFHQGFPNKDGQTWTNQTSRFQLIGVQGQDDVNLTIKKGQHGQEQETLDNERGTHASEEEEQTIEDVQLEMLPFSSKYEAQIEPKKQKAKHNDLPLQRSISKTKKVSDQNRAAWLEQRNRHLELELRRHQVHLASTDELHVKYNSLKIDYKQILQSFERSEEIRREQKELINEQQSQIKTLKSKLKKSETTVFDLTKENETIKLAHSSAHLSQIFSFSKGQQSNQSHLLKNSYANRSETQPVSVAYPSDFSRSPSSKVSTTQLSRSQLQNTNYMVSSTQNLWQPNKDSSQRPSPYIAQPNSGTDLIMHEGYSVLFDGTSENQTRKSLKKSKQRSRSNSERKHKKSRKQKHSRKKRDQSGKKLERSRSNSTSKKSTLHRKSSRSKHLDIQSVNQSYLSLACPSKNEKKQKKRSQSRRGKKNKGLAKDLGYILNIQTQQSDIIKGVHRFESTKGSTQIEKTEKDRKKRSSSGGRKNKEKSLRL